MLNSIGQIATAAPLTPLSPAVRPEILTRPAGAQQAGALGGAHEFGSLFTKLIDDVEATRRTAAAETNRVLLGQSDQLHSAVISLQESSIALNLMVEVRNKLVESYQELMRMPV